MNLSKLLEMVKDRQAWCVAVHGGCKELDAIEKQHISYKLHNIYQKLSKIIHRMNTYNLYGMYKYMCSVYLYVMYKYNKNICISI